MSECSSGLGPLGSSFGTFTVGSLRLRVLLSGFLLRLALLAAALLWMGWYGWKVNRDVDRKIKRLEAQRKSKEPRIKEREDYWAA